MKPIAGHCPNCGVNLAVAEKQIDRRSVCAILHMHPDLVDLWFQVIEGRHPDVELAFCGGSETPHVHPKDMTSQQYPPTKMVVAGKEESVPMRAVEEVLNGLRDVEWPWKETDV